MRDMQAIPPSTRIIYPVKSSLPAPLSTATARSSAVPCAFDAFVAQQNVGFAFSSPPNHIPSSPDPVLDSQITDQRELDDPYDSSDSSLPVPEPEAQIGDSNTSKDIYVFKNPLPQPSLLVPPQLGRRERNLIRNLAPGECLRLGYGSASGPHFLRIPHPAARDRAVKACDGCRTRKSKCTGERPICLRCTDRGIACVYSAPRVRGPTKYQLWLRKQKVLLEEKQNSARSGIRLSDLPPHLIAFDPRIKAFQEQQRPGGASAPSAQPEDLDGNVLQRHNGDHLRHTAFALPSNIAPAMPIQDTDGQPQQDSYPSLDLHRNQILSLPGPSSAAMTSSSYEQQALQQKLNLSALQLADSPALSLFDGDSDTLFTPLDARVAEFDRQSSIHGDDYIWVDQMDEPSIHTGSSTFDPLAESPINLPPPLNTDPSRMSWPIHSLQDLNRSSCSPADASPSMNWCSSDRDRDAHQEVMSNTSSMDSNGFTSGSSGLLPRPLLPLIQGILPTNGQDQTNLQDSNATLLDSGISDKDDKKQSASVSDGSFHSTGLAMSPSMMFDFESYEHSES